MRKLLSNKMRMLRPSDAFLPLAFLAAAYFGPVGDVVRGFLCFVAVKLLALASSDGLRVAFATQPSLRGVRGSTKTALALQFAAALLLFAFLYFIKNITPDVTFIASLATGLLLNIEQVFYEYLCATNDGFSATLCRAITAIMLFAGCALGRPLFQIGTVGCATLVSILIGLLIGGGLKGKWSAQPLRIAPRAMLQTALYTAPALLFMRFGTQYIAAIPQSATKTLQFMALCAGLTLYSLSRTPFRRAHSEAKALNITLTILLALCAVYIAACLIPGIPFHEWIDITAKYGFDFAVYVGWAAGCGLILYGNFRRPKD